MKVNTCPVCKKNFERGKRRPARFCSDACKQKAYRTRPRKPAPDAPLRAWKVYEQLVAIDELVEYRNAAMEVK